MRKMIFIKIQNRIESYLKDKLRKIMTFMKKILFWRKIYLLQIPILWEYFMTELHVQTKNMNEFIRF